LVNATTPLSLPSTSKEDVNYLRSKALEAYEQATGYFRILAIEPNDVDALADKGAVLAALGRYDEAMEYFRALAIEPDYVKALNNKGVALDELDRHQEAIA
jgi:Flp pilus assembly protein TadD